MIVEADFVNHWKTRALANSIGSAEALRAILLLWSHCQTRRAWEFRLSPLMLAGICDFAGAADVLWQAMTELEFLEPGEEEGWWQVHDWGTVNAGLVGQWAGGARVKGATWHAQGYAVLPNGSTPGETPGSTSRSTTGSTPRLSGGDTDRIGLDRKREDGNKPPKPPKGGDDLAFPEDWSEARKTTMQRWLDYKTECRKRYKSSSWVMLIEKLSILPDEALNDCVNDSITQGWQGLFPERWTLPPPTGEGPKAGNGQKKEGAAPDTRLFEKKKVPAADFPWRDVAISVEGWTPVGDWEDQTPRSRQTLRESWANLSPQGKSAIWALAQDGTQVESTNEEVKPNDA